MNKKFCSVDQDSAVTEGLPVDLVRMEKGEIFSVGVGIACLSQNLLDFCSNSFHDRKKSLTHHC